VIHRLAVDRGTKPLRHCRCAVDGELTQDGDPAPAGHVANAILKQGARLGKEHKDSKRRIDAAASAVMAVHRAAELADTSPASYP
jgi:phage terminase large subunit-like protein